MTTRISKIARLPKPIRKELNSRLENGQMVKSIEQWLNTLPETQATMAEHFPGRPITHQNVSDWRRTGYQDWLLHQERMQWFDRFSEQDIELKKHERTADDSFEALGRFFVIEIGQGIAAIQQIKNPHDRCEKMQHLAREFARLQNAYNWSRRVLLAWKKHNFPNGAPQPERETAEPLDPPKPKLNLVFKSIHHTKCYRGCICKKCHPEDGDYPYTQAVKDAASRELGASDYWTRGNEHWRVTHCGCECPCDSEKCHELERTYCGTPASPKPIAAATPASAPPVPPPTPDPCPP